MSKILAITGATGKKSSGYFTQLLCEHSDEINAIYKDGIRVVARETSDTSMVDSVPLRFQKYIGSIENIDFLKTAFHDVDTIVHIAGIHWSKEVIEAASSCRVRRIIAVHTTGIYSKYKKAGEEYRHIDEYARRMCSENNIDLTILRPTMIYGNPEDKNVIKFIRMVDRLPLMPVVNGARYELQPVHYSDLGKAYYGVLMNEEATANKEFILSGSKPITLRDMLLIIGENLGKKVRFFSCPFPLAYAGAWLFYCVSIGKIDYREKVQRLVEPRAYGYEEAAESFGYCPVDFSEGIKSEVKMYIEMKQTMGTQKK